MEEIIVINLADKTEYSIYAPKSGENGMICPVCSADRKKKTEKCFSFNRQKMAGRCNHCNVVLVEKKEFKKKEYEKVYIKPLFKKTTTYSEKFVKYFTERKISEKILLEFGVGEGMEYMPYEKKIVNTIQFNYFRYSELVNIKYRSATKSFKMVKDAELIFYNIDCAINNDTIIICEGEIDMLSMAEAGFKNTVSVPNGAGLGKINFDFFDNCIDLFSENTKFIIAVDNDKAGNNLQNELVRRLGAENCTKVIFKDCKDANECLVRFGIQTIIESVAARTEFPIEGVFTAYDIREEIFDYYYHGLPKGFGVGGKLDEFIRFQPGYLTTITGIPTHGKSEWLDFVICRLNVLFGWKFGLYSPENHPLPLHFAKLAEKILGKPFEGYKKMMPPDVEDMINYCRDNFYFINPSDDEGLDNILATIKSLVRRKGITAFVIDPWNRLDHQFTTNETRYISEQLDKILKFCEKQKVHGFLVAHPTKIPRDKTSGLQEVPNLYTISGSAHFFNKTSNGVCVYRNFQTNKIEIHTQKVKFKQWGGIGMSEYLWDYTTGRYYEPEGMPNYDNWLSGESGETNYKENGLLPNSEDENLF